MARVRRATVADAEAVAEVHVEAWRAGYRGLLPDEYLDSLDLSIRAERWRQVLESGDEATATTLVVEDDEGRIVGIASVGHERGGNDSGVGELWMLNLAPEAWGRGIGALVLEAAEDELRERGFSEAVLWVLDRNARARRFYERAGWRLDGAEKEDSARGFPVRELRHRRRLCKPGR